MRLIKLSDIPRGEPLRWPIYHESGHLLFARGEIIDEDLIQVLRESSIRQVFALDNYKIKPERFREQVRHKQVSVIGLSARDMLSQPVFSNSGQLLVPSGQYINDDYKTTLIRNNIQNVAVKKNSRELKLKQVSAFNRNLRLLQKKQANGETFEGKADESDIAKTVKPGEPISDSFVEKAEKSMQAHVRPSSMTLVNLMRKQMKVVFSESEKQRLSKFYQTLTNETEVLFSHLRNNQGVQGAKVGELSQKIMKEVLTNQNFLLSLTRMKQRGDFLFNHSLNVSIVGMNIAIALGYSEKQVREIGVCGLLHDVGMLLVKPEIVGKKGKLTSQEMAGVKKHPAIGLKLLQNIEGVDQLACVVLFQEHERGDGSGYPRGLKMADIHDFAKVISVADVFDALCNSRPHRGAQIPYKAVETILRATKLGQFDKKIVTALLKCVGLFPIGSWVQMTDASIARVIQSNFDNFDKPVVKIFFRGEKRLDEPEIIDLCDKSGVTIEKAIDFNQSDEELLKLF
ncbi:MAG: HD-GYP domain-containing protein [Planctomycetes bacterium]|nr:HD-GYP domain-containing protein [Planctomycetota bacterium]